MGKHKLYDISGDKSGNEESGFFNTKGRISRNAFFLRLLLVLGTYLLSCLLVYADVYEENNVFHESILPFLLSVFLLIQGAKRMHDVDRTGWAFLIPVYNVYLSLLPGTRGNNSFGVDPIPLSTSKYFNGLDGFNNNSFGSLGNSSSSQFSGGDKLPLKTLLLFLLAGLLTLGLIFREDLIKWVKAGSGKKSEDDGGTQIDSIPDQKSTNNAPTNIYLEPNLVMENMPPGIEVGTLTAVDEDKGDTHTYELVTGREDADNGSFTISGDSLKTTKKFDFESKNSYSILVQVKDQKGDTKAVPLTIKIRDDVRDNQPDKSFFQCKENLQKIKREKYHDGKCDCPDGSDEPLGFCK